MRKIILILLISPLLLSLPSCVPQGSHFGEEIEETEVADTSERSEDAATIVFSENRYIFTGEPSSISCEGSTIYIRKGGTYKLSGNLLDGSIVIDASDQRVKLILCGIEICGGELTPICVKNASEAIIETESGTENIIECNDPTRSAIISCAKLTLINNGSLTLNGLSLNENKS